MEGLGHSRRRNVSGPFGPGDEDDDDRRPYWGRTRGAAAALAFVLPVLGLYELGLAYFRRAGALRTGVDAWIHQGLVGLAPAPAWIASAGVAAVLLVWWLAERREYWCPPDTWLGMLAESAILGIGLVGLGRLVDLGFAHLGGLELLAEGLDSAEFDRRGTMVVGFLGAGIFEETVFRLLLIPAMYGIARALQTPRVMATTLAVTGSALLFSVAHHVGEPVDGFEWYVFIFRWMAGVYFAWVFILRGFGIAVGTHIAYDVLVGCVGWTW